MPFIKPAEFILKEQRTKIQETCLCVFPGSPMLPWLMPQCLTEVKYIKPKRFLTETNDLSNGQECCYLHKPFILFTINVIITL